MNRDLLIKLLTGIFAKLLRYVLTAVGGTAAINGASGEAVNFEQLAAGAASIAVAIGWSLWEDRVKKRANVGTSGANVGSSSANVGSSSANVEAPSTSPRPSPQGGEGEKPVT